MITAKTTLVKPGIWGGQETGSSFTRIWFIKKGDDAWMIQKNKKIILKENCLYIIPANTCFEYGLDAEVLIEWCHIQLNIFGFLNAFQFIDFPLEIKLKGNEVSDMSKILNSLQLKPKPEDLYENILFQKNKLMLLEKMIPKGIKLNLDQILGIQKLLPAIDLMKNSIKTNVGIEKMAACVHLERNYFSTLFKKVMGISPIQYYHQIRCQSAQVFLQNRKLTIEAIAQDHGYVDAFHFSKTFKKTVGISPSGFRKSLLINRP